jgi:hypothetical protein
MHTALQSLKALRRGHVHGGYRWAMVANDGELICESCVSENYRQIFRATVAKPGNCHAHNSDWRCIGLANSGEHEDESPEFCANCGKVIFESVND